MYRKIPLWIPGFILGILIMVQPAWAEDLRGFKLLDFCTSEDIVAEGICLGYIGGVLNSVQLFEPNGLVTLNRNTEAPVPQLCDTQASWQPSSVHVAQWLEDHPGNLNKSAVFLILKAIEDFQSPCQK